MGIVVANQPSPIVLGGYAYDSSRRKTIRENVLESRARQQQAEQMQVQASLAQQQMAQRERMALAGMQYDTQRANQNLAAQMAMQGQAQQERRALSEFEWEQRTQATAQQQQHQHEMAQEQMRQRQDMFDQQQIAEGLKNGTLRYTPQQEQQIANIDDQLDAISTDPSFRPEDRELAIAELHAQKRMILPRRVPPHEQPKTPLEEAQGAFIPMGEVFPGMPPELTEGWVVQPKPSRNGEPGGYSLHDLRRKPETPPKVEPPVSRRQRIASQPAERDKLLAEAKKAVDLRHAEEMRSYREQLSKSPPARGKEPPPPPAAPTVDDYRREAQEILRLDDEMSEIALGLPENYAPHIPPGFRLPPAGDPDAPSVPEASAQGLLQQSPAIPQPPPLAELPPELPQPPIPDVPPEPTQVAEDAPAPELYMASMQPEVRTNVPGLGYTQESPKPKPESKSAKEELENQFQAIQDDELRNSPAGVPQSGKIMPSPPTEGEKQIKTHAARLAHLDFDRSLQVLRSVSQVVGDRKLLSHVGELKRRFLNSNRVLDDVMFAQAKSGQEWPPEAIEAAFQQRAKQLGFEAGDLMPTKREDMPAKWQEAIAISRSWQEPNFKPEKIEDMEKNRFYVVKTGDGEILRGLWDGSKFVLFRAEQSGQQIESVGE